MDRLNVAIVAFCVFASGLVAAVATTSTEVKISRTWKDATGQFSVEATFVSCDGKVVQLRRHKDNRTISLPLTKLSKHDRTFATHASKQRQFAFDAFPPADIAQTPDTFIGHRFYSEGEITSIKPKPEKPGELIVTVSNLSGIEWVTMKTKKRSYSRWVKRVCVFSLPEQRALSLSKGYDVNVSGNIEQVEVEPNERFSRGNYQPIRIHLSGVTVR